ncbi:DUF6504 family protein [Enemella evansiae]|uniref:DUF6504 family protein n=1 Tax=Enemella evansiae TaxID=2016499 RepID=UPI000B96D3E7|nr:DUF6504 family protein [Enemella evansiae]OYO18293.1 hypothetical protein BI335_08005 [Enemella evansiae]TDO93777.1 hypothetical protein C8D81_1571 [Enemella evansiae]
MRIHREAIAVRDGVVDGIEAPVEFCWRGLVWQVTEIQARWVLTSPWWESPAARAVRDGGVRVAEDASTDLIAERIGWRVLAERGSVHTGSRRSGVFELQHATATGWWLDAVID